MKKTTRKFIRKMYRILFNSQEQLSKEMQQVLNENRWELYEPSCKNEDNCSIGDNYCKNTGVCELEKTSEALNELADKLLESIPGPADFSSTTTENLWNSSTDTKQKRGSFIVIDGPDGAGKSSIVSYLKNIIPDLVVTRDPGGTLEGMEIRKLILSEHSNLENFSVALGFLISRYETQQKIVLPNIEKGKVVVSDRWDSSTFAYQQYAEGLQNEVDVLNYKFLKGDYFIHLDIDPEEGIERSFKKAKELGLDELRFEKKGEDYTKKVKDGFDVYKNLFYTSNNSITINTSGKTIPFICGQILMFLYKKGVI